MKRHQLKRRWYDVKGDAHRMDNRAAYFAGAMAAITIIHNAAQKDSDTTLQTALHDMLDDIEAERKSSTTTGRR